MKLNKIFNLLLSCSMLLGVATACTDEVGYDAAGKETNAQAYFSKDDESLIDLEENQNSFTINVYRATADGSSTVNVASEDASGLFSIPSSVTFADGQTVAPLVVTFDFAQLTAEQQYPLTLTLDENATTTYGKQSATYTVQYAPWSAKESFATGTFHSSYWGDYYEWEGVTIYKSVSLVNPDKERYYVTLATGLEQDCEVTINYDKSTGECSVPMTYHYTSDYGDVYLSDIASSRAYMGESNYASYMNVDSNIAIGLNDPCYYDAKKGRFVLNLAYTFVGGDYDMAFYYFGAGTDYLQLDGYEPYTLTLTSYGHWVNDDDVDNAVLYVQKTDNITGYKAKLYTGALSDAEISAAYTEVDSDEDATVYDASQYFTYPLTEKGYYTLVTVGYDATGSVVAQESLTFKFKPLSDTELDWDDIEAVTLTNSYTYSYGFGYSNYYDMKVKFAEDKFLIVDFLGSGADVEVQYDNSKITAVNSTDEAATLASDGSYLGLYFDSSSTTRCMYPMGDTRTSHETYIYPSYSSQALSTYKDIVLCAYTYYDDPYVGYYEYYYIFFPEDKLPATSKKLAKSGKKVIPGKVATKKINLHVNNLQGHRF